MYLAENIRFLRRKKNYSQEYISQLLGYKSYTTIQKWETGLSEPSITKLKELADLFNVDLDKLMNQKIYLGDSESGDSSNNAAAELTVIQKRLLSYFNMLNQTGQYKALDNIADLTKIPDYIVNQ